MTAIKPQIIKSYAANELEYMEMLVIRGSKYMVLLLIFICIPIFFETPTILRLWLGQIPDYTAAYIRLVLWEQFFTILNGPLWFVANATGYIKKNQVYGRMITLLALPVSAGILLIYPNPIIPMIVLVVANMGYWVYCLYDIHRQIQLNILQYITKAVVPPLITAASMSLVCFALISLIDNCTLYRLILVCILSTISGGTICLILSDRAERQIMLNAWKKISRQTLR